MADFNLVPVDHDPFSGDLAASASGLPQRPSPTQQWQSAIEEQRQRDLRKPSMGEQVGNIITDTGAMMLSPITNQAKRMQQAYEGGIDWSDPEAVKQASGGTLLDMMGLVGGTAGAAERGTVGALGGKPKFSTVGEAASAAKDVVKIMDKARLEDAANAIHPSSDRISQHLSTSALSNEWLPSYETAVSDLKEFKPGHELHDEMTPAERDDHRAFLQEEVDAHKEELETHAQKVRAGLAAYHQKAQAYADRVKKTLDAMDARLASPEAAPSGIKAYKK